VEYAPLYRSIGLGTTVWSPLASGLLTGKYNEGIPEGTRISLPGYEWLRKRFEGEEFQKKVDIVKQLAALSKELGCSLPQMALAWCLKNPNVSTVITGASRPQQVVENMQAIEVAKQLTDEVMEKIEGILGNKPEPEKDWR